MGKEPVAGVAGRDSPLKGFPGSCGQGSTGPRRGHGFHPCSGKIPHASERLGPHAPTIEPAPSSRGAATTETQAPQSRRPASYKSPQRGAARHNSRGALLATPGGGPRTATETQHSPRYTDALIQKPHRWRREPRCDRLGQRDSPGEGPASTRRSHFPLHFLNCSVSQSSPTALGLQAGVPCSGSRRHLTATVHSPSSPA